MEAEASVTGRERASSRSILKEFFLVFSEKSYACGNREAKKIITVALRAGTEGEKWYIVCIANNYEMFLNLLHVGPNKHFLQQFWKLYIMGSVKVDAIGVSVGQKERPNGLSVGSRSVSDKKVVPRFIQDKIRIGSLIYRRDRHRASQTGSSFHRKPGIGG